MVKSLFLGLVLVGLSGVANADDEFPKEMLGFWGDSTDTCQTLKAEGAPYVLDGSLWLKITKTDVVGTTQGRFLQATKAMMIDMKPAKFSVLVQTIGDDPRLVDLTLSLDGKIFETIVGARASSVYLKC